MVVRVQQTINHTWLRRFKTILACTSRLSWEFGEALNSTNLKTLIRWIFMVTFRQVQLEWNQNFKRLVTYPFLAVPYSLSALGWVWGSWKPVEPPQAGTLQGGMPCSMSRYYVKPKNSVDETIMFYKLLVCYCSNFDGDANTLELGQEVEYTLGVRGSSGSCRSAENVKV